MKAYPYFLASMALVIAFLIWRLSGISGKLDSANSALTEKGDSIRYFRSESGKIVAEKTAAEISLQDFRNHYSDLAAELRDIKVREKSLKAILKASMEAKGSGQVRIVRDTIRLTGGAVMQRDSLFTNDGYLDYRAEINDQSGYRYLYQDTVLWLLNEKKKWFLGNERLYADFRLSNPNARALNMTSVLIRERDKRFVISAGVSYDPFGNQFIPAIHAGYALFKL